MKRIILSLIILWQVNATPNKRFECEIDELNPLVQTFEVMNGMSFFMDFTIGASKVKILMHPPLKSGVDNRYTNFVLYSKNELGEFSKMDWKSLLTSERKLACRINRSEFTIFHIASALDILKEVREKIDQDLEGFIGPKPGLDIKEKILQYLNSLDVARIDDADQRRLMDICKYCIPELFCVVKTVFNRSDYFEQGRDRRNKLPAISFSPKTFESIKDFEEKDFKSNGIKEFFIDESVFDRKSDKHHILLCGYSDMDGNSIFQKHMLEIVTLLLAELMRRFCENQGDNFSFNGREIDWDICFALLNEKSKKLPKKIWLRFGLKSEATAAEPALTSAPAPVDVAEEPKVVAPEIPDGAWRENLRTVVEDMRPRRTKKAMIEKPELKYIGTNGLMDKNLTRILRSVMDKEDFAGKMGLQEFLGFKNTFNLTEPGLEISFSDGFEPKGDPKITFARIGGQLHIRIERGEKKVFALTSGKLSE